MGPEEASHLDVATLLLERYEFMREQPDELWRARPHGLNSLACLVWHIARVEDGGLNRLVFDRPQVLDDETQRWPDRIGIAL